MGIFSYEGASLGTCMVPVIRLILEENGEKVEQKWSKSGGEKSGAPLFEQ